ncbi:hypothetical protein BH20PSE1_BH20PSE1_02060 [soil metagenome]
MAVRKFTMKQKLQRCIVLGAPLLIPTIIADVR